MKSGFIAITGRPNAGKSTLLNKILGEKIAIVSNKPQTTRTKIQGVYTDEHCQLILIDTPGIHKSHNKLGNKMEKSISTATKDIDVLLYVVDCNLYENEYEKENKTLTSLKTDGVPIILVINKIDTIDKEKLLPVIDRLSNIYDFSAIVPISAQKGANISELTKEIMKFLPEGPKFFPDDTLTDQPEKQIVAEFIREKALRLLNKEIPHGIAVEIEKMKIREDGIYDIEASIYCERKSHKAIIIGKGGTKLRDIGTRARCDIERFLDAKVFLKLWVKVNEDWRNKEKFLNMIGFD